MAARGGLQQAAEELADFYRHKYAREDAEPDPVRVHALRAAASVAPPPPPPPSPMKIWWHVYRR